MDELTETQIRHLEAIQAVITRMASNSFALKTLTGTISAAVIAYAGVALNPSALLPAAACLPIITFGMLDANYLRLERLFRKLYDGVRKDKVTAPFDMNFMPYNDEVDGVIRITTSWSVMWYYYTLLIVMIVLAGVLIRG